MENLFLVKLAVVLVVVELSKPLAGRLYARIMGKRARRTITLNPELAATVTGLQKSAGVSTDEHVIADAVGFYGWARKHQDSGRAIAVVDSTKDTVNEVILPHGVPMYQSGGHEPR